MNIMLILDFTDVSELFLFWNNWINFDFFGDYLWSTQGQNYSKKLIYTSSNIWLNIWWMWMLAHWPEVFGTLQQAPSIILAACQKLFSAELGEFIPICFFPGMSVAFKHCLVILVE